MRLRGVENPTYPTRLYSNRIGNVVQKPCLDTEWYTDVVVNTENPEFFISVPLLLRRPGDSYKALMHHACLDKRSEHVLVILDSTGRV